MTHDAFVKELADEYECLRKNNKEKRVLSVSMEEARKNKLNLW